MSIICQVLSSLRKQQCTKPDKNCYSQEIHILGSEERQIFKENKQ